MELKDYIRDVPDFPEPGILFKDITPMLANPQAFGLAIDSLEGLFKAVDFDAIVAVESRGFLFGAPLADRLKKPIIPVRKPGKLPAATHATEYALEYGTNTMEIHVDGISKNDRVLLLDDLLATGGTLAAAARLVEISGGIIVGTGVVIELLDLNGRKGLEGYNVKSLIQY
ncbi:MAG TPA: adenine phosphoribosyltransferase [Dehalococcoidia bacterium]|mgnify:FL=1|nr:adenine phosphoribosyltransferase [Chloroflexota bacterium]HAI99886.1 adenine phosphoribosyltransferase [Dehalococcoidia bacterium]